MKKAKTPDRTVRTFETKTYLSVLRNLVEEGNSVSLNVSGMSMFPFLEHERDIVFLEAPNRELRKGDIVFFQRIDGQFVMHRIYRVLDNKYFIVGDMQTLIEGPVTRDQIFALVTQVKRNGKMLNPSTLTWKFFEKVWLNMLPYRSVLVLPYRVVRKVRRIFSSR